MKKKIRIPIYKGALTVIQDEDMDVVFKKYNLVAGLPGEEFAACCWTQGMDCFIAVSKSTTIPEITHEAFHIAVEILRDRGYNFSVLGKDQEPLAYLVEWIMKQCCLVLGIERKVEE